MSATDSPIKVPTCYASCSIGSPTDPLPAKLDAISAAGFDAIELSFPDLQNFANSYLKKEIAEDDYENLCIAGTEVKELCDERQLKILVLQPFSNFEGWPEGSPERKDAFERAEGWIRIMQAVGTDMLQVGSAIFLTSMDPAPLIISFLYTLCNPSANLLLQVGSSDSPSITSSTERLASDLAALADLLAPHSFSLAYENWCWATHAPTWRSVYDIVRLANRPNIGLCLDTFQTAGSEWADPTTSSGLLETPGVGISQVERNFKTSLEEMSKTIPSGMIYFLQISDAYKMDPPMDKAVDEQGLRPRGRWSHDWRPLPFRGGYLPVVEVARAVLKTGYQSWFSIEVFDGKEKGNMGEVAKMAMQAQEELMRQAANN
ncbi:hypothetical protein MMC15_005105 [Xylographa vitiligo]|nr:hypothetical protein [Xylographa vitiligo]